jgi:uncharacterized protein (DUF1697 family)
MPAYVGLLRAVNVGGSSVVRMDALSAALAGMGLEGVTTLLQSGNFVFRGDERDATRWERDLASRLAQDLRITTEVFVRTSDEWREIIARNPFPTQAVEAPNRLLAVALKTAPSAEKWRALDAAIRGPEHVRGDGRTAYIDYPEGVGRSRLTPALIERTLETRGTARNWNTVLRLGKAVSQAERPARSSD